MFLMVAKEDRNKRLTNALKENLKKRKEFQKKQKERK
jgi:hypothetical protein